MPQRLIRIFSPVLLALAAGLAIGCAATSYQTVPMADSLSEAPAADKSRVYVARSGQMTGAVKDIVIRVNGEVVGALGRDGYMCVDAKPGRTIVQLLYQGPLIDGKATEGMVSFEGEPAKTYYYRLHLDSGTKQPVIDLLDSEAGKAMIADRSPAEER